MGSFSRFCLRALRRTTKAAPRALGRASGGPETQHAIHHFGGQAALDQHVIDVRDQLAGGKAHLVGIAHHRAIAMMIPALVYAMWGDLRAEIRRKRIILALIACLALGLLGFAQAQPLCVRSNTSPVGD